MFIINRLAALGVVVLLLSLSGCKEMASKVEPPVRVTLESFLIETGFYVVINNTHQTVILENVNIKYTDARGGIRTQAVGVIRPQEGKRIDPSAVHWRIERGETITITANGYVAKTISTSSLLD